MRRIYVIHQLVSYGCRAPPIAFTSSTSPLSWAFALVGFTTDVPGSVVVVPTPFPGAWLWSLRLRIKQGSEGVCARCEDVERCKKPHDEQRGGRRNPGVRQPGAGRGQLPARSKSAISDRHSTLSDRHSSFLWIGFMRRRNFDIRIQIEAGIHFFGQKKKLFEYFKSQAERLPSMKR